MQQAIADTLVDSRVTDATQAVLDAWENDPAAPAPSTSVDTVDRVRVVSHVFACSPMLMQLGGRWPGWVRDLLDGTAPAAFSVAEHVAALQAKYAAKLADSPSQPHEESLQFSVLREHRQQQMLRILWRDLERREPVQHTLTELTALADAAVQVALLWAHASQVVRFGEPLDAGGNAQQMIVLGMGKLGGGELNVSSDIDLIYLYPESGQTTGPKVVDNREFFQRVAQRLTRSLHKTTEDGFVFRVDTRLRPFGESGPLVVNFDGLEHYYLTQGRDWERYAMIKSRCLTGDDAAIATLRALTKPFVYRRYLDYNAVDALRQLKQKIVASVRERGQLGNIKLGAGGIREIEFIAQAFQLVRGGRIADLQVRPTREVLTILARLDLLDDELVESLREAYDYLRVVENALQTMRDQQVHSLPTDEADQQRLLGMLDLNSCSEFHDQLTAHQMVVKQAFADLFADLPASPDNVADREGVAGLNQTGSVAWWQAAAIDQCTEEALSAHLQSAGYEPDEQLINALQALVHGPFFERLTATAQERLERLLPDVLALAAGVCEDSADATRALQRCLAWLRAVAGRSGYLQVLMERKDALARLLRLFADSGWVARFLLQHPILIDELLLAQSFQLWRASDVTQQAEILLTQLAEADLEEQMDRLRHWRQAREFAIAVAELDGELPLMKVSDQLSWLSEAVIDVVLSLCWRAQVARFGTPCFLLDDASHHATVGVVAYGKLGGLELGHGSDLDLVFLHDSHGRQQVTDGQRSIENAVFFARLLQKFVHFMTTSTPAGVLYDIDLRLRPNGTSGVLVTGIQHFADYQQGNAWTWEHQALVRARMVQGATALREKFATIRQDVLTRPRDADTLLDEVVSMRRRMLEHLSAERFEQMHLKQDTGGITDIEFMVQFVVLRHAHMHPELLEFTDNVRLIERAERLGLMAPAMAEDLRSSYIALRQRQHRQALQEEDAVVPLDATLQQLRDRVAAVWTQMMTPRPARS